MEARRRKRGAKMVKMKLTHKRHFVNKINMHFFFLENRVFCKKNHFGLTKANELSVGIGLNSRMFDWIFGIVLFALRFVHT